MNFDIAFKKAEEDVEKEVSEKAVTEIKKKLRSLHAAKRVVKNIEREIEDLKDGFYTEISDVKSCS